MPDPEVGTRQVVVRTRRETAQNGQVWRYEADVTKSLTGVLQYAYEAEVALREGEDARALERVTEARRDLETLLGENDA